MSSPINRLSSSVKSRSKGANVAALLAYHSGLVITDENGRRFHYPDDKNDPRIFGSGVYGPPSFNLNMVTVAAAIGADEHRCDAQLCHSVILSLPLGLTAEENWAGVEKYIKNHLTPLGLVCTFALHTHGKNGEYQPHAHLIITMREWDPHWDEKRKRQRYFSAKKNRVNNWKKRGMEMDRFRAGWTEHLSQICEEFNLGAPQLIGAEKDEADAAAKTNASDGAIVDAMSDREVSQALRGNVDKLCAALTRAEIGKAGKTAEVAGR